MKMKTKKNTRLNIKEKPSIWRTTDSPMELGLVVVSKTCGREN